MTRKEKKSNKIAIIITLIVIILLLLLSLFFVFRKDNTNNEEVKEVTNPIQEVIEKVVEEVTTTEEEKVNEEKDEYYYVSFLNLDDSLIQKISYKKGSMPSYNGDTPTFYDGSYNYTFTGWDKKFSKVNGNQVYKAQYDKTPIGNTTNTHQCSSYTLKDDGSWVCKSCGKTLSGTDSAYFTVLNDDDQPTTIIKLTKDVTNTSGISKSGDNIVYTNSGDAKDVIIKTTGGKLIINDTNNQSHQTHYGYLNDSEIDTGDSCFVTHGVIDNMQINDGKVIADKDGYVMLVKAASGTTIEEKNNGKFAIDEDTNSADVKDVTVIVSGTAKTLGELGYDTTNEKVKIDDTVRKNESFVIATKSDLYRFRDLINKGINIPYAKLTNDIDISSDTWTPIGTFKYPYHGYIDGNGKKIKGLTGTVKDLQKDNWFEAHTTQITGAAYGFIAIAGNGDVTVKDLTFNNANIDLAKGNSIGVVIGYLPNTNDFSEVISYDDTLTEDYQEFDGHRFSNKNIEDGCIKKIGENYYTGKAQLIGFGNSGIKKLTLDNINVSGSISGNDSVGGLVGKAYNDSLTITNCETNTKVKANGRAGGLVGYIRNDTLNWNISNNTIKNDITSTGTLSASGVDKIVIFEKMTGTKKIYNNETSEATMHFGDDEQKEAYTLAYSEDDGTDYVTFTLTGETIYYSYVYSARCINFENAIINNTYEIDNNKYRLYGTSTVNNSATIKQISNFGTLTVNNENGTITKLINYANATVSKGVVTLLQNSKLEDGEVPQATLKDNVEVSISSKNGNITIDSATVNLKEGGTSIALYKATINDGTFNEHLKVSEGCTLTLNKFVTINTTKSYHISVASGGTLTYDDKKLVSVTKDDKGDKYILVNVSVGGTINGETNSGTKAKKYYLIEKGE